MAKESLDHSRYCQGFLEDLEQFNVFIKSLKTISKSLITNCFLFTSQWQEEFARNPILYEFNEDNSLTVFIRAHDFYRVFFWIIDVSKYVISNTDKLLVCDFFYSNNVSAATEENLRRCFQYLGFMQYKSAHRWICKQPSFTKKAVDEYVISTTPSKYVIEKFYYYLDKYMSRLPEHNENGMLAYMKERKFISLFDASGQQLLAAMTYRRKTHTVEGEQIFVDEKHQGKGLGSLLLSTYFDFLKHDGIKKHVLWIEDENVASQCLHAKFNYVMDELMQITLVRYSASGSTD